MRIVISPKDTDSKIVRNDVKYSWQEGEMFCLLLNNDEVRKYPLRNIWYISFNEQDNVPVEL